jgi:MFS family permease
MIISGICCGIGQSLLWTSQGFYISTCAEPVEHNKGLYFSLFWSTYMLSQVFGNLLAAFIIDLLSQVTYFYIMAAVCLFSCIIFGTLKKPDVHSKSYMKLMDPTMTPKTENSDRVMIQAASTVIEPPEMPIDEVKPISYEK